jgi:hypothetical protein
MDFFTVEAGLFSSAAETKTQFKPMGNAHNEFATPNPRLGHAA